MYINVYLRKCSSDRSEKCFVHTYVLRKAVRSGGYSVDPAFAVEQMKSVREFYLVADFFRIQYLRFTFLEAECKDFTEDFAEMLAQKVCEVFGRDYQLVYGVHHYKDRWHLHIILNPVNMHTGEILLPINTNLNVLGKLVYQYCKVDFVCFVRHF